MHVGLIVTSQKLSKLTTQQYFRFYRRLLVPILDRLCGIPMENTVKT